MDFVEIPIAQAAEITGLHVNTLYRARSVFRAKWSGWDNQWHAMIAELSDWCELWRGVVESEDYVLPNQKVFASIRPDWKERLAFWQDNEMYFMKPSARAKLWATYGKENGGITQ